MGDLALVAFYYLLWVGEYTIMGKRNDSKQNALVLADCLDMQIQKMGQWQGGMFKEYIQEELACYATGMSMNMKR